MGLLMFTMRRSSGLGSLVDDWWPLAEEAGARHGVDPAVVLSIITVESSGNPDARGAAGEIGLMQVMPATAQMVSPGITAAELREPTRNVDVGTRYLADQLARYGGDLAAALSAYNAGTATARNQSYVDRVLAALGPARVDGALEVSSPAAWGETLWDWIQEHPYMAGTLALVGAWWWRGRR